MQRQQVAKVEAAVDQVGLGVACGHPLVVGLKGCRLARRKAAFGGALVVFGTGGPGVVGDFMVVPHGNHGCGGMQRLQIGIGLVLRVAHAVVGQCEDLGGGQRQAAQLLGVGRGITTARVLIQVVAQVHGGIEIIAARGFGIHVEVTRRVIGAREHGQLDLCHAARGQRAGARCGRLSRVGLEAVVESRGGLEAGGIDLDGEVLGGCGCGLAFGHHRGEGSIRGQFPLHRDVRRVARGRCDARPQHDAVAQGVATGHAVGKPHLRVVVAATAGGQRQGAERSGAQGQLAHEDAAAFIGGSGVADGVGRGTNGSFHGCGVPYKTAKADRRM